MPMAPIGGLGSFAPTPASSRGVEAGAHGASFGASLMSLVENAEKSGADANLAVSNMIDKTGDVHDAMIALQRAEMTLQLTVQIRNKLVQAYQDIMRMPV
jgi:flagellar hook-basal body complex protein FliE